MQLYGNVYSSPGISLAQKQLLMAAFLSAFDMPDQLFGHLLAAFKFGNSGKACEAAMTVAFEQSGVTSAAIIQSAAETLQQAHAFLQTEGGADWQAVNTNASVTIPEPASVTVPALPAPFFSERVMQAEFAWS